jgi:hypothetical protein
MDEKFLIVFEDFWRNFTGEQDLIPGTFDKETFYTHDFGKITRYKLAQILTDKFQAKKYVILRDKKQITKYTFNPKILSKLVEKYNISLPVNHILYQDRPTLESNDEL